MSERMKIPFVAGTAILLACCIFSVFFFGLIVGICEMAGTPLSERAVLTLNQIATFLIPGLVFAYYFYDKLWDDLKLRSFGKRSNYGWFVLIMLISYPFMVYTQKINEAMTFPEAMFSIEQFLRTMEQRAEETLLRMVSGTSPKDLILMLFNMAVVPAVCEEVFFRGVVLNNLIRRTSKIHLSVWLTAIFFSFIHFQFFGFLPRMILGALFGYAFVLSKSLWVPMLLHFLNNAYLVVVYYLYNNKWISVDPNTWDTETATLWMAVLSLIASVGLLWFIFYRNKARSSFA